MDAPCFDIREFCALLAQHIETEALVTITRLSQAVGLFVPLTCRDRR
jgi:hypothetical protein